MDVRRVAALALVLALAGCTADPAPPGSSAVPARGSSAGPTVAAGPFTLAGAPPPSITKLRLIFAGAVADLDAGQIHRVPITGWLRRPGSEPLLVDERRTDAEIGPSRVSRYERSILPGGRTVARLTAAALTVAAASADGGGLWLAEHTDQTRCTIREVGLDGRDRRPSRPHVCAAQPVVATPHGLWVRDERRTSLLDPETLTEKASYPRAEPIDTDRVLVLGDQWELRNLRTGVTTPVDRPPARGWPDPRVGDISPDGGWLPFTFGEPSSSPQVMDVWVLDLDTIEWTRLPLMPTFAALKGTDLAWTGGGALVLVGRFPERGLVATWKPVASGFQVRPFDRPPTPAGAPVTTSFIVFG